MPRYSEERRQAVVAKLLPPPNLTPHEVSEQEGISVATVYKWRKEARAEGRCLPDALGKGAGAERLATGRPLKPSRSIRSGHPKSRWLNQKNKRRDNDQTRQLA